MAVLLGLFFILFGAIFFFAGGGLSVFSALLAGRLAGRALMPELIFAGVGFFIWLVGVVLVAVGLIKGKKRQVLAQRIFETGTAAEATITFFDKNYRVLINNKPIYSIIEFTFRDSSGTERTGRKTNLNSDLAIRLNLQVGGKVQIKYLSEDPGQNILVLPDPKTGRA